MSDGLHRVEITRGFLNIFAMQVCAVDDATDEEILARCNRDNPAGTTFGWSMVVRKPDGTLGQEENKSPVACEDHAGRTHLVVLC